MVQLASILATAILAVAGTTLAHPGEAHHQRSLAEIEAENQFNAHAHRSLAACANKPHFRELQERAAARRLETIQSIHEQRRRLSVADVLNKKHKTALSCVTPNNYDKVALFGSTPKCVLYPEVTQGPYYVKGEYIRNDARENQPGIDLYTLIQFIDINTCTAVPNYYIDFWGANSTGVYSGVLGYGNGDDRDISNYNTTFMRALAPTDKDGLVQFITKYPGHYTSRTHHLHIVASHGGKVLQNNTYVGGGVASVGQVYFDQDLSLEVLKTSPYNTNKQVLTKNDEDPYLPATSNAGFDPVLEYALLGDTVEAGVFSWISIGINATQSREVKPSMLWTSTGGKVNPSFTNADMELPGQTPPPQYANPPTATPATTPSAAL